MDLVKSPPLDRAVRVGVVGAGSWSALAHVPAVLAHPCAELIGVADHDPARLAETCEHYGVEDRFANHRELLAAGPDALVIATPHATHHAIARDAIDAGVHVLLEKPLTVRADDARDLARRARAAGLHLVAGYTFNFTAGAAAARAAVEAGELGELALVSCLMATSVEDFLRGLPGDQSAYVLAGPSSATYSDPALAGGGQGQAQVSHVAEMLLWVTGRRARRVCALMADRGAPVDVVDALAFELEGGALGTIASTGGLRPSQAQQLELRYYGSRALLLQDLVTGEVVLHPADGPPRELAPAAGTANPGDGYPVEAPVGCLIELIRGEGENRAPAAPAVATVELLEAAYRSAARGGKPISISDSTV
jgi:predicted dehydrogenase